ncbi:DUF2787 domain-containing protein [Photobacterium kishitanii]|uniref:DUF2787 domain-containing protein n=1 Tax=Photobacterium kishitanii TaxID=318456 RepID=UPI0007F92FDB|nr:DUF2787 domain-containing protein [Photobacterium kishitanii]OBU29684.1 hypothetical protein AYY23_08080 [Photobacterium kishitanii]PSW49479.1 DUF2787 domain-containing protein [Photobacterium kishitanii]
MSVISFTPTLLPVSNKLKSLLNQALCDYLTQATQLNQQSADRYTFSFKDTSYDAENGGFRPVEIAINQQPSGEWNIEYITEFAYFGNYYPELERSMDFDISNNSWFTSYSSWLSLKTHLQDAKELYQLWEGNFLAYVDMDAYDQIKVSC